MNTKMLLAPVLAVILALSIAGAISQFLPQNQLNSASTPLPSGGPQAASMADIWSLPLFIMFIVAAVIVGIVVALLFFRERNLNREMGN